MNLDDLQFGEVLFDQITGIDNKGECTFFMHWRTDYIPGLPESPFGHVHGQIFRADMQKQIAIARQHYSKVFIEKVENERH
jgi:hypothetical protein